MNDSDLAYASLGPCEEYEFDLVELVDGALTGDRAAHVQRHLEGCGRCRAFVTEVRAIDASLASTLPRVELSADFEARLHGRIAQLSCAVPKEAARAAAEAEFRAGLHELRRSFTRRAALLTVGCVAAAAVLASILEKYAPSLLSLADGLTALNGPMGLGVAGVAVAAGLLMPRLLQRSSRFALFG
jgi:anti-sigma factor RsiW